ncbi:GPN-loop GTPase 3 [Hondaea fermentalgiana]|uniref:GPN-loop GTPase 3 n=1 Tax=Hondaea fermentalgiana TaxID=2315210 RepID=A0A2R5GTI1_9STRA|nr:GPN-loop GTPase 3 [Hondaea fermentalgiana]|eukprot:GBG34177.1 GPN-loop GTPase 3 [Hondaea fermentalgiana]
MGRYAQVVVGPAGSGKSTYCFAVQNYLGANATRLPALVVNLDPGQERTEEQEEKQPFDADVRDLISVSDVLEELDFGPNGALVFCMEHLVDNMEWLKGEIDAVGGSDDEYFIFDCPGQIELYTHIPVLRTLVERLQSWNFHVCVVHVIDALFIDDTSKFISGALLALTSMLNLQAAAVNVVTKCDLKKETLGGGRRRRPRAGVNTIGYHFDEATGTQGALARLKALEEEEERLKQLGQLDDGDFGNNDNDDDDAATSGDNADLAYAFGDEEGAAEKNGAGADEEEDDEFLNVDDPEYFNPGTHMLRAALEENTVAPKLRELSESICEVLDNYNLVNFIPLDITSESSFEYLMAHIDAATQYGEDLEPRDPGAEEQEEAEDSLQNDAKAAALNE